MRYLFNVMNTYSVEADSEAEARERLETHGTLKDSDTMLVEVVMT